MSMTVNGFPWPCFADGTPLQRGDMFLMDGRAYTAWRVEVMDGADDVGVTPRFNVQGIDGRDVCTWMSAADGEVLERGE